MVNEIRISLSRPEGVVDLSLSTRFKIAMSYISELFVMLRRTRLAPFKRHLGSKLRSQEPVDHFRTSAPYQEFASHF
jgi:hypothetical protein